MTAIPGFPPARRQALRWLGALGTAVAAAGVGLLAACAALLVGAWRTAMLVVAVALGGCAALPEAPPAPAQVASTAGGIDAAATPLGRLARASAPDDGSDRAGFRWLVDGPEALGARIALVRAAERTIDVQVYLIGDDATGRGFLLKLERAAARGVHVRLLLDDLHAGALEVRLARLAASEHAEVRLFNPLPARSGGQFRRIVRSLHEAGRIHRRMHDKLLVVDASFAIAGGRNVADAYFERAAADHFIDVDVLTAGPSVPALLASFNAFWDDPASWPIERLGGVAHRSMAAPDAEPSWPATRIAEDLEAGRLELVAAAFALHADGPAKVRSASVPGDGPSAPGGAVAAGHRALLAAAESEVLVVSPYVVPGPAGTAMLAALRRRGVAVSVMTNSLASTDEPLVHLGYARYRERLLDAGVALHELVVGGAARADGPAAGAGLPIAGSLPAGSTSAGSLARLHGKVSVVDRRRVFVGSMNLDPRSDRWNTELGLVLESPQLAAEVRSALDTHLRAGCWRVERRPHDRALVWRRDGGSPAVDIEPGSDARAYLRARLLFVALGEEML